jgi:hypothetical protein
VVLPLPACAVNFVAFANVLNPEELEAEVSAAKGAGRHSLLVCEQVARNNEVFSSFATFKGYFSTAVQVDGADEGSPQFAALLKIYHPSTMDSSWLRVTSRLETFQLQLLVHDQYTDLGRRLVKDMSLLLRAPR